MTIAGKTVLVTGASRGIGRALVEEALARGAAQVYAGTRRPLEHPDGRVTPLILDITSPEEIRQAAGHVEPLDILVNNAGVFLYDDLSDRAALDQHLAVNFYGNDGERRARGGVRTMRAVNLSLAARSTPFVALFPAVSRTGLPGTTARRSG